MRSSGSASSAAPVNQVDVDKAMSTLPVLPLVAAFLLLQRYWQTGLTTGAVK
ncbi:hypothetical protein [Lentzea aerocolonigenes]|uniref:hypothetical protein n=1 Tax=Lentzea aerocolonigenes TaxID=68170 RepID=UPI000B2DE9D0|nr:hypothetical protein [Lentzea aerocolonigenes]